jgi:hypothetical protein
MKPYPFLLIAVSAVVGCLVSTNTPAATSVSFTKPEAYVDVAFSPRDRDDELKILREHFEKLGAKLPAGQDFKVEVLDVDLAGRVDPSIRGGSRDLRVLRGGADWPMVQFRYTVEQSGKAIKTGEARVSDMNYLNHFNRYPSGEPMRYEKAMLDDWFKKEILATP